MTQRPTAPNERARACPFLAFEDDRDMRSDRPDHRHRCFAEKRPAPRAIAHQEAFCLSPAFPSCPTFQDWARREAAQARAASANSSASAGSSSTAGTGPVPSGMAAGVGATPTEPDQEPPANLGLTTDDEHEGDGAAADPAADRGGEDEPPGYEGPGYEPPEPGWLPDIPDLPPARNASRSWAAPPPWAGGRDTAGPPARSSRSSDPDRADEDARPAAGLASSRWLADVEPGDELDADVADAPRDADARQRPAAPSSVTPSFLAGRAATDEAADAPPDRELAALVARQRPAGSPGRRDPRPMAGQQRPGRRPAAAAPRDDVGPSWERPRRFEAYPTLKTRVGMPAVPRIAVGLIALLVAAVLVFMIPALFFSKGTPGAGASSSPTTSIGPSVSHVPTPSAAPTPTTYTIVKGDNLSKIAKKFGVTQAQILTANPQIKDPNKIKVGDVIVIPLSVPSEIIDSTSPSASPVGSASSAP